MNKFTQIVENNIKEYGFEANHLANSMAISIVRDVIKAIREQDRRSGSRFNTEVVRPAFTKEIEKQEGYNPKGPTWL